MQYVAYYRVSTDRQGRSGLGLDAQRAAVAGYLAGRAEPLAEYTEIESGRKNDRPQLACYYLDNIYEVLVSRLHPHPWFP